MLHLKRTLPPKPKILRLGNCPIVIRSRNKLPLMRIYLQQFEEETDFVGYPPIQHSTPYSNALQQDQLCSVEQGIKSLLVKEVIVKCEPEEIEFVSSIFTVCRKDSKLQLILNLKKLKTYHQRLLT